MFKPLSLWYSEIIGKKFIYVYIYNVYVCAPGSWHRALKTLVISSVMRALATTSVLIFYLLLVPDRAPESLEIS